MGSPVKFYLKTENFKLFAKQCLDSTQELLMINLWTEWIIQDDAFAFNDYIQGKNDEEKLIYVHVYASRSFVFVTSCIAT